VPPQIKSSVPVQAKEEKARADGAPVVDIAVHVLVEGL
jgi:hypothetical protein